MFFFNVSRVLLSMPLLSSRYWDIFFFFIVFQSGPKSIKPVTAFLRENAKLSAWKRCSRMLRHFIQNNLCSICRERHFFYYKGFGLKRILRRQLLKEKIAVCINVLGCSDFRHCSKQLLFTGDYPISAALLDCLPALW